MWQKISVSLIKKAFFVNTEKKIMHVRAFERYIPLRTHVESFYKHRDVNKRQSLAW